MKDVSFVGSGKVGATLRVDGEIIELTFFPGGDADYLPLGEGLAEELSRIVTAHFAANADTVRLIRYRGELAPITVEDLARFAVPILPAP